MKTPGGIRSVRDQITDRIRDDLLCGRIPSGERLSEAKLAEMFGVSRGPIRESLAQLTNEGLLISKPNCGVTVAPVASSEIHEVLVPIRKTIELYALKGIFDSLGTEDFLLWEEILHRMETACRMSDVESIALSDIAFHRHIIDRANNPDLRAMWQAAVVRLRGYFREATDFYKGDLSAMYRGHRKLLDAFLSGKKEIALWALEEHIW